MQLLLRASRGVELDRKRDELEQHDHREQHDRDLYETGDPAEDAAEQEEDPGARRERRRPGTARSAARNGVYAFWC